MTTPAPLAAAEDALRWRDLTGESSIPRNMLMEWSVERKCCIGRMHPTPEGDGALAAELERLRAEVELLKVKLDLSCDATRTARIDEASCWGGRVDALTRERDEARAERDALRAALLRLADAADGVGIRHFDTDWLDDEVQEMQNATEAARGTLVDAALRAAPPAAPDGAAAAA